jgi:predicted transcriptional regulator
MDHSTDQEFTLRLPQELHTELVKLAQAEHLSFQSLLVAILREAVTKNNNVTRQEVMDEWDDRSGSSC